MPGIPLTIVLLAYNEEPNLRRAVELALAYLAAHHDEHELIVVDDGSRDATAAILRELAAVHPRLRPLHHERNRGMGAAFRTGYDAARCEWVVAMASDLQVLPTEVAKLTPLAGRYECVSSVYHDPKKTFDRRLYSALFRAQIRLLYGRCPTLEGLYLFRRALWGTVPIHSDSFFLSFEFLLGLQKRGLEIPVVEIELRPREHGASKVTSPRRILNVSKEIARARWRSLFGAPRSAG